MSRESGSENRHNPEIEQRPSQRQIDWLNEHVPVISFRHGGGAGGQNKNKVSSAAELRWRIAEADPGVFSPMEIKMMIDHFSKSRKRWVQTTGEVLIQGSEHRDYEANRQAVLNRLIDGVTEALNPDPNRIPTRPTRSSVERRLEDKKRSGREKQLRKKDFE
ncbi:MAG: aminoacyl-tRNA hydrolase [Candidatus Uhrbacteria bacterium]